MQVKTVPIALRNDGALWFYFLGCGGAFSKRLYQTNVLVVKGTDHLLVDCGTRGPEALAAAGISTTEIMHFLPTHSHADHVGGVEELSLTARYVARHKPTMYISDEYQTILWERTLRGGCEFNERFHGKGLAFEDYWNPVRPTAVPGMPRDGASFDIGNLNVKTFRTRHYPQQAESWRDAMYSVGIVVDDRVLYTADTQYDEGMLTELDSLFSFETIFHDVQFHLGGIHASLSQLEALPAEIRAKTYLVHYGDTWEEYKNDVARLGFRGLTRQQTVYSAR